MDKTKILTNVRICNFSDCWIWLRSTNSAGYGQLTENKRYWLAHRYSYSAFCGVIPKYCVIRHMCNNCKCVNPAHLQVGTHKDNYKDSINKHKLRSAKLRKSWEVNSIKYFTCREVCRSTGLSMNSVIKHTIDGVFDIKQYRKACKISNKKPKV